MKIIFSQYVAKCNGVNYIEVASKDLTSKQKRKVSRQIQEIERHVSFLRKNLKENLYNLVHDKIFNDLKRRLYNDIKIVNLSDNVSYHKNQHIKDEIFGYQKYLFSELMHHRNLFELKAYEMHKTKPYEL